MTVSEKSADSSKGKEKSIVYSLSRPSRCHGCDRKLEPGQIVKLENAREDRAALCRQCSSLDTLELIPKGNAAITRLASKYSTQTYVVMKWSEVWKCYERIGVLTESDAVDRAEAESKTKLARREHID